MQGGTTVHQSVAVGKSKYRAYRPFDYIYDPNHVVSGAKDYHKCCMQSLRAQAEFTVCPSFPSMFSDHPKYPRLRLSSLCCQNRLPRDIERSWWAKKVALEQNYGKPVDVRGVDRHNFFRRPMTQCVDPVLELVCYDRTPDEKRLKRQEAEKGPSTRNCCTQTDYRESETQTIPWEPPYKIVRDPSPEILTLAMLSWGKGLPAGMHEVEIIERARIKRAWEAAAPPMDIPENIEMRREICEYLERDEWAFREQEIQTIQDMRLELTEKLFKQNDSELSVKYTERLNHFWTVKHQEKEEKLKQLHRETNRALRKLSMQHKGISKRYKKMNIIEEHANYDSELYGPQMRFGDNPKNWHEVIKIRTSLLTQLKGIEMVENVPPRALPAFDYIKASRPKPKNVLCIRETKWTEKVLEKLHEDLRAIRLQKIEPQPSMGLIKKIESAVIEPVTPTLAGIPDWEEELYQASIFLQKIIKGRAIQTLMYRERRRCQQLIEELKSTHALTESDVQKHMKERLDAVNQQREEAVLKYDEECLNEVVSDMEGETVGNMLDFLSKELWRLQDERRAHAFAMLAERERRRREAAEAGRRQAEERRRREHDEMFKQVVKVHQDTVDLYLEDVIVESMTWVAETEARSYVREVVKIIDEAAGEAHCKFKAIEEEELVADLINNFVVPEVQKEIIRKKIKARQEKYIRVAHATIYEVVSPPAPKKEEESAPLSLSCVEEPWLMALQEYEPPPPPVEPVKLETPDLSCVEEPWLMALKDQLKESPDLSCVEEPFLIALKDEPAVKKTAKSSTKDVQSTGEISEAAVSATSRRTEKAEVAVKVHDIEGKCNILFCGKGRCTSKRLI